MSPPEVRKPGNKDIAPAADVAYSFHRWLKSRSAAAKGLPQQQPRSVRPCAFAEFVVHDGDTEMRVSGRPVKGAGMTGSLPDGRKPRGASTGSIESRRERSLENAQNAIASSAVIRR